MDWWAGGLVVWLVLVSKWVLVGWWVQVVW